MTVSLSQSHPFWFLICGNCKRFFNFFPLSFSNLYIYSTTKYNTIEATFAAFTKIEESRKSFNHPNTEEDNFGSLQILPFALMADLKSAFLKVYSQLKSELLEDPAFEFTDDSRQWVDRVFRFSLSVSSLIHTLLPSSISWCVYVSLNLRLTFTWFFVSVGVLLWT